MSYLIVYAGPNGSGKSTLREQLGEKAEIVIDPDQIARRFVNAGPCRSSRCLRDTPF